MTQLLKQIKFKSNLCQSFLLQSKYAPCISDNADLRVILSVLYTILEVIRLYDEETAAGRFKFGPDLDAQYTNMKQQLRDELSINIYFQQLN